MSATADLVVLRSKTIRNVEVCVLMRPLGRHLLLVALVLLLAVPPILGQATTGSLTGKVTSERNPLPGVTVTISSRSMQGTRTDTTGEAGGFHFPSLPPGDYT